MPIASKFAHAFVVLAVCSAGVAQVHNPRSANAAVTLQEHYNAAQRLQQTGRLEEAAAQYRAFLAAAQTAIAFAHASAGDYPRAASLFDEALIQTPESASLRLLYAKTALSSGDLPHAESLARNYLRDFPADRQGQAEAHQLLGRALLKMNRNTEARKELETAVALDPTFENGYDLAIVCLDLDDGDCAARMFAEMQASFGDRPEVHMHFGQAYANSDFAPRAVDEFKKVIAEDPRYPGVHYALAAALMMGSEDEAHVLEAESELKKELVDSPKDFLTYAALGKIAINHQRFAEAEGYLKKATELNPANPDAFLYLGQMYFDTQRIPAAEAALRKAIQLTTDPSRNRFQIQKAHFLLGRILMQEHKPTEAHAEMGIARSFANRGLSQDKSKLAGLLDSARTADADGPDASSELEQHSTDLAHEQDPKALQQVTAFELQLAAPIADSYNNLGAIAAGNGHYVEALTSFEHAAEWKPSLEGLDLNWGRAAFMASRFSEAIAPLSHYLRKHPEDSGVRSALGMSQYMNRDYTGCLATLKDVADTKAAIPQAKFVYADSMVKTGQVAEGMKLLRSLAASSPDVAEVHRGLGEALAIEGQTDEARNELLTALRMNPNDPQTNYDLGKLDLEKGATTAATAELERAVKLMPTDPVFHKELASAYAKGKRSADVEKELRVYRSLEKDAPAPQQPQVPGP